MNSVAVIIMRKVQKDIRSEDTKELYPYMLIRDTKAQKGISNKRII